MRSPRLKVRNDSAVYHCISRIVGGAFLLQDLQKEQFRKLMWTLADFCGVQVITYTVMGNHFHMLARVPKPAAVPDRELERRVRALYPKESIYVQAIEQDLKSTGKISAQLRQRLLKRMGDISMFLKEVKQRFTRRYNREHDRYGTLWAERFKSTLVEDAPAPCQPVAAYVDLNSVRAGAKQDPKDYRFCGYAEALAGGRKAREGLTSILPGKNWAEKMQHYRKLLFCTSGVSGHSDKKALTKEQIQKQLDNDAVLALSEILRLKVRYMTDGGVLGSREYVNTIFVRFRRHFGKRRRDGARSMKGADWGGLMVLRALRNKVFG
jgi:putative transposase